MAYFIARAESRSHWFTVRAARLFQSDEARRGMVASAAPAGSAQEKAMTRVGYNSAP